LEIRTGKIAGAPRVRNKLSFGRWDARRAISGTLFPAEASSDGMRSNVTWALAIVVFLSSVAPCSSKQFNTSPHLPCPLTTKGPYKDYKGR
jgi:hypothetical protein